MKLSEYTAQADIHFDGIFDELGYSSSNGENILTFCDNLHYLNIALNNKNVSSIIIKKELLKDIKNTTKGISISDNPRNSFFVIYNSMRGHNLFKYKINYGIGENVSIASSASVSSKSYIGNNSVISENVTIKDNVYIGDNCFIDAGAVIGNDGILFMEQDGNNIFIRHAGIVHLGNNVTILSNATVVKSLFPNMPTTIDDYSIIGIATTIGHEARIGKNCKVLGNCVVAKNSQIGDGSIIGSSSVIRENLVLGENVDVKAGSIVVKNIKDGEIVSGNFAINHNLNVKNYFKSQK